MSQLTFFTVFALIFGWTAANIILKLVITNPTILTGVGGTLVRVCKTFSVSSAHAKSCSSGSVPQLLEHPE